MQEIFCSFGFFLCANGKFPLHMCAMLYSNDCRRYEEPWNGWLLSLLKKIIHVRDGLLFNITHMMVNLSFDIHGIIVYLKFANHHVILSRRSVSDFLFFIFLILPPLPLLYSLLKVNFFARQTRRINKNLE